MLLDAALTEDVPAGIERGRPPLPTAANRAHTVVGDATLHPLLLETLLEGRRIDLDAAQALREARRMEAMRSACAAACRLPIRRRCALRLRLGYLQSSLTA